MATLVRRIRRVIMERAHEVHHALQPAAYFILANVAEHGPKRASVLVEEFGIDKGAISRQVQQLVDLGFVERTPDPADGRAMMLGVTDEGRSGSPTPPGSAASCSTSGCPAGATTSSPRS